MSEGIVYLILMGVIGIASVIQNYKKETKKDKERNQGLPPRPAANATSTTPPPFSRQSQSQPPVSSSPAPLNTPTQSSETTVTRPFSRPAQVQSQNRTGTTISQQIPSVPKPQVKPVVGYTSSVSQSIGASSITGTFDYSKEGVSALGNYVEMTTMEEEENKQLASKERHKSFALDTTNTDELKKAFIASLIFERKY